MNKIMSAILILLASPAIVFIFLMNVRQHQQEQRYNLLKGIIKEFTA